MRSPSFISVQGVRCTTLHRAAVVALRESSIILSEGLEYNAYSKNILEKKTFFFSHQCPRHALRCFPACSCPGSKRGLNNLMGTGADWGKPAFWGGDVVLCQEGHSRKQLQSKQGFRSLTIIVDCGGFAMQNRRMRELLQRRQPPVNQKSACGWTGGDCLPQFWERRRSRRRPSCTCMAMLFE